MTGSCCADCGKEEGGGASLKACKSCMLVKYCNAKCQRNHWPKHKKECKLRAAELRDEALFKDPPPKEDCPICFLPMPDTLICCKSLPPATLMSVPIYDYAEANEEFANRSTEVYYTCCGKDICAGCVDSFVQSGTDDKCPFCNSDRSGKTEGEKVEELMKRVEANDAGAMYILGSYYTHGQLGLSHDQEKAIELYVRAAELGNRKAHYELGVQFDDGGDLKKAKIHYEAAAIAGHEAARCNLGTMEAQSGNMERAVKHWKIAASAGHCHAMHALLIAFEDGLMPQDEIESALTSYNNSCAEMRSETRDRILDIFFGVNGNLSRTG
jgi:tetratricopeptide (TPR) repeat protein